MYALTRAYTYTIAFLHSHCSSGLADIGYLFESDQPEHSPEQKESTQDPLAPLKQVRRRSRHSLPPMRLSGSVISPNAAVPAMLQKDVAQLRKLATNSILWSEDPKRPQIDGMSNDEAAAIMLYTQGKRKRAYSAQEHHCMQTLRCYFIRPRSRSHPYSHTHS